MKIFFVNPPSPDGTDFIREGRCMQAKSSWAALWMPLTLAYSASFLRAAGHITYITDCIAERLSHDDLTQKVLSVNPDLVVINIAFPTTRSDIYTALQLKKSIQGIKIAAIGLCGTILGSRLLSDAPEIDYVISGEPEWVLQNLAEALGAGNRLQSVRGIIFRSGAEIIVTPPQTLSFNNPDDLPFPARDLLSNECYRLPLTGKKFTLLSIGRGCPYQCIYCTSHLYYGRTFRKRSVASIVTEIRECVMQHNISNFLFWGESFTMDPEYGEEICREIIKQNLKITWSTTSRVDTLNATLLQAMKQSGCAMLGLGIESSDQAILDEARKGITVREIQHAVTIVKKSGIKPMGHFIFGLPGETRNTADNTTRFALSCGIDYAQFYCAVPYPGTELRIRAERQGWIGTDDYSRYDLSVAVMRNAALTAEEIKKLRDAAYRKFYLRPHMLFQILKETRNLSSLVTSLDFLKWIKQ